MYKLNPDALPEDGIPGRFVAVDDVEDPDADSWLCMDGRGTLRFTGGAF